MRLAVSTNVFWSQPIDAAVSAIASTPIRRVAVRLQTEARLQHAEALSLPTIDDTALVSLSDWSDAISAAGLEIVMIELPGHRLGENGFESMAGDWMQAAASLGVEHVLVAPTDDDVERPKERAIEHLAWLAASAAARGMTVLLDTTPRLTIDSVQMQDTMKTVNHHSMRLHFDPGAYLFHNPQSQVEIALQRVLAWVGGVALKDCDADAYGTESPPLGQGVQIGFARILEILKALRFDGPCVIDRGCGPWRTRKRSADGRTWLDESLEHLGRCGWLDSI